MRQSIRKRNNRIIAGLLVVVTMMTVAYAAFATKLNISSTSKIDNIWNIQITNIEAKNIVGTASNKSSSHTDLTANFETKLISPGDSITYEVTVKNNGGIDAELNEVKKTYTNSSYISVTYKDLVKGQMLYKGESAVMKVEVTFIDKDYEKFTESITSDISITLDFVQKGNNVDPTKKYLVTYDTQGGTYEESKYVEWDERGLGPVNTTKLGYNLLGWFSLPGGSGQEAAAGTPISYLLDDENAEGITLYARWSAKSYTINYDTQNDKDNYGGIVDWDGTPTNNQTLTSYGYDFMGWYTKPNGKGLKVNGDTTTKSIIEYLYGKYVDEVPNNTITLYGYWKDKTYTLVYMANDSKKTPASNIPENKTIRYTQTNIASEIPIREGYTFDGWWTTKSGGEQITSNVSVKDLGYGSDETINIYAHWIKNS